MNETTKNDMIMIMHRLKRLIGSFYHQKRIDIIITSFRAGTPGTMREKRDHVHNPARLVIIACQFLKRCNTVA